jgi:hypothetical protein
MTLRLNGSTSGYTEIDAPAVAGSNTLVLPTGNGSADQALVTNGSGTLSFADRGRMTLATAQNSTSGTSIDFTSIPSWVKRVTVMFSGVSTSGTSSVQVQLGTGAGPTFTTSGYLGASMAVSSGAGTAGEQNGTGFRVYANTSATNINHGNIIISNLTSNTWSLSSVLGQSDAARVSWAGGSIALAAALTAIRITTVNGTDTFDAGSINILFEG